jgi:NAD(P)-dependent dehydrogenase (short-subunit alcohol dehydrogenase family)
MSDKRVVLISGSSSGIGFASALEYAKAGFHVVATMRYHLKPFR